MNMLAWLYLFGGCAIALVGLAALAGELMFGGRPGEWSLVAIVAAVAIYILVSIQRSEKGEP